MIRHFNFIREALRVRARWALRIPDKEEPLVIDGSPYFTFIPIRLDGPMSGRVGLCPYHPDRGVLETPAVVEKSMGHLHRWACENHKGRLYHVGRHIRNFVFYTYEVWVSKDGFDVNNRRKSESISVPVYCDGTFGSTCPSERKLNYRLRLTGVTWDFSSNEIYYASVRKTGAPFGELVPISDNLKRYADFDD